MQHETFPDPPVTVTFQIKSLIVKFNDNVEKFFNISTVIRQTSRAWVNYVRSSTYESSDIR